MAALASMLIGDPPELWEDIGFQLDDGGVWVSGAHHRLGGEAPGIRAFGMRDFAAAGLDGWPATLDAPDARETPPHPNGVIALDHVVVSTPDLQRTIASFEADGIRLRRTRDTGTEERPTQQAFFKLEHNIILEVVGSRTRAAEGPPRFYGLAFTVADLDATAAHLGTKLRPAKDAVQPGRRIATLDRSVGSSVPIAFMSA